MMSSFVATRYQMISSQRDFDEQINAYDFALACFVQSKYEDKQLRKEQLQRNKELYSRMKAASVTGKYKKWLKREVGFLMIDISKKSLHDLVHDYQLQHLPQCLLFRQGEVVDSNGSVAHLTDISSKRDILDFVDDYFGKALDDLVDQKKKEEQEERAERIARYNAYSRQYYWNPYGGWGPYYYGPGAYYYYGYPRAHVGFSVSV